MQGFGFLEELPAEQEATTFVHSQQPPVQLYLPLAFPQIHFFFLENFNLKTLFPRWLQKETVKWNDVALWGDLSGPLAVIEEVPSPGLGIWGFWEEKENFSWYMLNSIILHSLSPKPQIHPLA